MVRLPVVILALVWGMLSVGLSTLFERAVTALFVTDHFTLTVLIAPLVEEGFKSVAIIMMYIFVLVRYSGDAMIYGFAVGSGFAIVENVEYVILEPLMEYLATGTVSPYGVLGAALARTAATGLMHGTIAATVATVASSIVHYRRARALWVSIALIGAAILVHIIHNAALWLEQQNIELTVHLIVGGIMLFGLILLLNFNVRHEYNQILKELHYDPMNAVEHTTLASGEEVNLLNYIRQQQGRKQMKLAESYLVKQGQIAVYVEHLDNGDFRETAIRELRRAIHADRIRARRIFDRMDPDTQAVLQQANLVDAVPLSRLGTYGLRREMKTQRSDNK